MDNQNDWPYDQRVDEEFVASSRDEVFREAEDGNSKAMVSLAALYKREGDEPEQERWLNRALNLGSRDAIRFLGWSSYDKGDKGLALHLFNRAISLGDEWSMVALGQIAEDEKNFSEAIAWFQKAADLGNARAMGLLALRLHKANRRDESRDWFIKGGEGGDVTSMTCAGIDCRRDNKPKEAKQWFLKALGHSTKTDQLNMEQLADVFLSQSEIESALNWFAKAAAIGSVSAALEVARRSRDGEKWDQAHEYFLQVAQSEAASTQERADAMLNLATLAQREGNAGDAETWSRQAMENGSIDGLGHVLRLVPQVALTLPSG